MPDITITITDAQADLLGRRYGESAASYVQRVGKRLVEQAVLDYCAEMERAHFRRFESAEDLAEFLTNQ